MDWQVHLPSTVSAKHCFQTVDKAEVTIQNQPQLAQGHNKKGEIMISPLFIACTFTVHLSTYSNEQFILSIYSNEHRILAYEQIA